MKKILVLLTILFLAGISTALITSINETNDSLTKEEKLFDEKGLIMPLCNGGTFWARTSDINFDGEWRYSGDVLTEQTGTCNVRYNHHPAFGVGPDTNLHIAVSSAWLTNFPGLTYPNGMIGNWNADTGEFTQVGRIGTYIDADLNWNKPEDYCFTEKFTTRNTTGTAFPLYGSNSFAHDRSKFEVQLHVGLDFLDHDYIQLQVQNLNKPLIGIGTDKMAYNIAEGQTDLEVKLTLADDDLLCGQPNWNPKYGAEYKSAETFEIRINGTPLNSVDANSGAFGVQLLSGNQGELTLLLDANQFNTGTHDVNITVIDTDGYHTDIGAIGPFTVENYYTQIETIVQVTKEGGTCGDVTGDGNVYINDLTFIVAYLFEGGPTPNPFWTGDVTGDGNVYINDLTAMVAYLFQGGSLNCSNPN